MSSSLSFRGAVVVLLGIFAAGIGGYFHLKVAGLLIGISLMYLGVWISERDLAKRNLKVAQDETTLGELPAPKNVGALSHDLRPLLVLPNRGRFAKMILGSFAFVAVCILIPFLPPGRPDFFLPFAEFIGVPFALACSVYGTFRLASKRPLLLIDKSGLTDNASAASAGFIAWSEIESMKIVNFMGQDMLTITVRDPRGLMQRVSPFTRAIMKINSRLVSGIVNIPGIALSLPLEDVLEQALRFRSAESSMTAF